MLPLGFKPLPYSKSYYVSKTGLVWSKKLGRLMNPYKHPIDNYLQLVIHGTCKKVHQLVLEAFRGMCPIGEEACHYDGNPHNNNLDNLRWDTRISNQNDKKKHGRAAKKLTSIEVVQIKELLHSKKMKQKEIARLFNVNSSNISRINTGDIWNHV